MNRKHLASVAAAALAAALLVPGLAFASPTNPDTATTFTDAELAAGLTYLAS